MNAPPPKGRPRRLGDKKINNSLPAVPVKGLQKGDFRVHYDFYGSGVIRIYSYLFSRVNSPDPF